MRRTPRHSLALVDRPGFRRFPLLPTCACGWKGVPGRRRFVVRQYREHARQRPRPGSTEPRALTPIADLPEELR